MNASKANAAIIGALSVRIVEGENRGAVVPLKEFLAVNGFESEERAALLAALIAGNTYAGGGGAMPVWRVDPVISDLNALERAS